MASNLRWEDIFSINRVGQEKLEQGVRSGFQRDFDRLIFSSAFRRLQNKTQVFPLPGSTFVHNRLTHSLEVASVGRSLGKIVGSHIAAEELGLGPDEAEAQEFYRYELSNVIAAACLAHDIGNPAFGHSGEKALSAFFAENAGRQIDGRTLQSYFSPLEWSDLVNFEGNANAFRILTHTFKGKLPGGFGLTYTTLAAILKYPCDSASVGGAAHRKKYGYFQTEHENFLEVVHELHMIPDIPPGEAAPGGAYAPTAPAGAAAHMDGTPTGAAFFRHPFVYLTEAADDICYQVIDVEDAHRLGIVQLDEARTLLLDLMHAIGRPTDNMDRVRKRVDGIGDANEKIAYLRARCINSLTLQAADVFIANSAAILNGTFRSTLIKTINETCHALDAIESLSVDRIYNHESVIQIEIAGYHVMSELLNVFVPPLLKQKPDARDKKMIRLIPDQFLETGDRDTPYHKVRCALDYISGMTDLYATELYRKLKGIDIPIHR
ncbi:dGTP triphosphohydrolase [Dinghuibacter silviterrae]|uniref:dGTPase n=1 Tax=Dinghuibacter silviterrae TaxID=1539049 RepID=A0A4R8DRC3_9BACT|nr:dNTP triphosphohydrolase [Dinghuibacter silviterrae]TDW99680.1 dGTPase [Dinghuibacter silviterrae]